MSIVNYQGEHEIAVYPKPVALQWLEKKIVRPRVKSFASKSSLWIPNWSATWENVKLVIFSKYVQMLSLT